MVERLWHIFFPYFPVYYFQNYAYTSLDNCCMFLSFLIKYLQGCILEISCDVYVSQWTGILCCSSGNDACCSSSVALVSSFRHQKMSAPALTMFFCKSSWHFRVSISHKTWGSSEKKHTHTQKKTKQTKTNGTKNKNNNGSTNGRPFS